MSESRPELLERYFSELQRLVNQMEREFPNQESACLSLLALSLGLVSSRLGPERPRRMLKRLIDSERGRLERLLVREHDRGSNGETAQDV